LFDLPEALIMSETTILTPRKTALFETHQALGGKLIPFAGWEMPVRYTSDNDEHLCVRNKVGIFDVSHMGEFFVEGPSALAFLQSVTSNDVSKLTNGKAQYSCFPNGKGGIVDDCIVYRIAVEKYMIVVNAGNLQKDWDWLVAQNTFGVNLRNDSDLYSLFSVSGPLAKATVQPLTDINLDNLAYYTFSIGKFNGLENVLIATTGYTGETCYEILIPNENAVDAWKAIMKSGEPHGIQPIGLGARDTLRLEMGYMLYGNDIDDTTSPLEAGLGWITKLDKGDFIDKAFLAQQKSEGLKKKLVGFEIVERGIPRHGYEIVNGDQVIGQVTSGTQSPSLQKGIGMGYVDAEFAKEGTSISIRIRDKAVPAKVVKPPFLKR